MELSLRVYIRIYKDHGLMFTQFLVSFRTLLDSDLQNISFLQLEIERALEIGCYKIYNFFEAIIWTQSDYIFRCVTYLCYEYL